MYLHLTLVAACAFFHYLLATRRTGFLTVDGVYSLVTLLMSTGTLLYVDPALDSDVAYANVVTIGTALYYVSSALLAQWLWRTSEPGAPAPVQTLRFRSASLIPVFLLVFSVAIGILYFYLVGYNVFLQGIRELGTDAGTNYQDLRIDSYSNDRNLSPGYVNQFKNTILPVVSMVVVSSLYAKRVRFRGLLTAIIAGANIILLAGTGQRGALILCLLGVFVFVAIVRRGKSRRWLLPAGMASVIPLAFLTFLLGRNADEVERARTLPGKSWAVMQNLLERIFRVQQESGIFVFRYIFERDTVHGGEWVDAVLGVLPGNPGTSLPREAYQWLYGTDRGTATPSVWGSAYYNFGMVGVILTGAAIGIICQAITSRFAQAESIDTWGAACYAMFAASFGAWVAGGPEYLLNAGPVTVLLLWSLGRALPRRLDEEPVRRLGKDQPLIPSRFLDEPRTSPRQTVEGAL